MSGTIPDTDGAGGGATEMRETGTPTLALLPVELLAAVFALLPAAELIQASFVSALRPAIFEATEIQMRRMGVTWHAAERLAERLELLFVLTEPLGHVTVEFGGRHGDTRSFPAGTVLLDAPLLPSCMAVHGRNRSQLFPRQTSAVVKYPPSIDGSWYEAYDVIASGPSRSQSPDLRLGPTGSLDERYKIKWKDGDPYEGLIGLDGLRLRNVECSTLYDLLSGPSLQVLVSPQSMAEEVRGGRRQWQPGIVREAQLAVAGPGPSIDDDEHSGMASRSRFSFDFMRLTALHSRFDACPHTPPALARALRELTPPREQLDRTGDPLTMPSTSSQVESVMTAITAFGIVDQVADGTYYDRAIACSLLASVGKPSQRHRHV